MMYWRASAASGEEKQEKNSFPRLEILCKSGIVLKISRACRLNHHKNQDWNLESSFCFEPYILKTDIKMKNEVVFRLVF